MVESYPLSWPVGRPRTAHPARARFHRYSDGGLARKAQITLYQGVSMVREELKRLGATDVVISTNVKTRRDGLPYSGAREPNDHGVAVYFRLADRVHCLACDRWDRVPDNLSAVAHHVEAVRGQSRWGVGDVAQAFAGYRALPAADAKKTWWALLGFHEPPAQLETARTKWRERIAEAHPDRGGNANQAAEINAAMTEAERFYASEENA
jgi:hypothetical protein